MQYLLLICDDPEAETYDPARDTIGDWVADNDAQGRTITGNRLRPPADAKTVRVRGDETLITDGPFAETRETIAGFDLLECGSLAEALDVAARHPMARFGRVEVRAVWPFEG